MNKLTALIEFFKPEIELFILLFILAKLCEILNQLRYIAHTLGTFSAKFELWTEGSLESLSAHKSLLRKPPNPLS